MLTNELFVTRVVCDVVYLFLSCVSHILSSVSQ